MTKEEFENIMPFIETLTPEQRKVIWYMEARKHENPCITDEQKTEALKMPLFTPRKMRFRNPIKVGNKLYTDTGNKWI